MIAFLLLLAGLGTASIVWLASTIAHDGLGVRPAPRSHRTDTFGSTMDA